MTMPLLGFLKILRDHTERRRDEERRALLLREMDHRVKNTLAIVQAVASQTLCQPEVPDEISSAFEGRLLALARSHDMLSRGGWESAPLSENVERTLEPYANDTDGGRVSIKGLPVLLGPTTATALNLAMHELATNAAKYGSLSTQDGHVDVSWKLETRGEGEVPVVVIVWRERGGPPVRPPERRGFGSTLLERTMMSEANGEFVLDFAPEGVVCRMRLPLAPSPE